MRFDPCQELSRKDAHDIIISIINSRGEIILSRHARERMRERRYTTDDVLHILLTGRLVEKRWDKDPGSWKYKIIGKDIDGEDGGVVTVIISKTRLVVITVLS